MRKIVSNSIVDDEAIEQLVVGELTGDRFREVLRALDQSRDGWRRCAIAFLQEQALSQELRQLSQSGFSLHNELSSADNPPTGAPGSNCLAGDYRAKSSSSMWKTAGKLNLLSLAASILVAFAVGWFGAGMRDEQPRVNRAGLQSDLSNVASMNNESRPADASMQPSLNLANFDPEQFVIGAHKSFVPIDRRIPEQLLELERRGMIEIETIDGIVPFELADGSAAVIPVQNFRVRPVLYAY